MKPVYDRMTEILLEAEKVSAAHRKWKKEQSTRREGWMDLKRYRKHLKQRGVGTKGTGEGPSRGRGGPESVERGESGDPEARGGSRSFRLPGGSRKAAAKIRKRVDAEHAARAREDMERQKRLNKVIADRERRRKAAEDAKAAKAKNESIVDKSSELPKGSKRGEPHQHPGSVGGTEKQILADLAKRGLTLNKNGEVVPIGKR